MCANERKRKQVNTVQNKKAEIRFHEKLSLRMISDENLHQNENDRIRELTTQDFKHIKMMLDAGCGTGSFGEMLASEGHEVVGLDISRGLISITKKHPSHSQNFMPIVGDLDRMPFKEGCFDMCISFFVLHHFPDIATVCSEFSRTLRNGGKILLIDTNGSNPYIKLTRSLAKHFGALLEKIGRATRNEGAHMHTTYIKKLSEVGFEDITVESNCLGAYPYKSTTTNVLTCFIYTIAVIEGAILNIIWKTLPQPLRGHLLLIRGFRKKRNIVFNEMHYIK